MRAAFSGSLSASQRSFVTVREATGTEPVASAHHAAPSDPASSRESAPRSRMRSRAAPPNGCRSTAVRAGRHPRARRGRPCRAAGPHGERGDVVEASGEFDGLQESGPPRLGVDLGPLRMRGSALAHDAFPGRVVDDYLARLCRRVDAGDVWTAVAHGASLGSDSGRGRLGADRGRDPGRCAGPVTWRTCRRRRPRANRRGCPRKSADPPTVRGARRPGGRGRRPPSPRRSRGRTRGRAGRSTSRG